MYIDDCRHTFEDLASHVLPHHMERLRSALGSPQPAGRFSAITVGPKALARSLGLASDFSGCYVLVEGDDPKYVGISRKVLSRLRQHFLGRTHYDASLAYRVAQRLHPTAGKRNEVMADVGFQAAFIRAQTWLRGLSVAYVQIDNPLELYVFEAYAAMALRTFEWNTFRTH